MSTIPKLNTIEAVAKVLHSGIGYEGYPELMNHIQLAESELESFSSWNNEKYTRNALFSSPYAELLLLCWEPGQESPIHTYKHNQGWIKILQGELFMQDVKLDEASLEITAGVFHTAKAGSLVHYDESTGYHQFVNKSDERCISLHLYVERVNTWKIFDKQSGSIGTYEPKCNKYFMKED